VGNLLVATDLVASAVVGGLLCLLCGVLMKQVLRDWLNANVDLHGAKDI